MVTEKKVVRMFSPWRQKILMYWRKLHIAVRTVQSGLQSAGWVGREKESIQSCGSETSRTTKYLEGQGDGRSTLQCTLEKEAVRMDDRRN
jgi:hypothetical protein